MKYAAPTTTPKKQADFALWVLDELRHITDAFTDLETDATRFKEWSANLNKVADGLIIFADGANFNPGSGRGYYGRHGGAWYKLDLGGILVGSPAALLFAGASADLLRTGSVLADAGALILTGASGKLFRKGPKWDDDTQCWDDDGSVWDDTIPAQPAVLVLTGAAATLFRTSIYWDDDQQEWDNDTSLWDDLISAQPGALVLTGASAAMAAGLVSQPGALVLTGASADLDITLSGQPGALVLTGADATFIVVSPFWDDDADTWDSDITNWDD